MHVCYVTRNERSLSIVNTDNVPFNGNRISQCVKECIFTKALESQEKKKFEEWLEKNVTFHNTMVDRITGSRETDPLVPYTEPLPRKALVIEDLGNVLPGNFRDADGVVVRSEKSLIEIDHLLKLRIANGTHTAMVYAMALSKLKNTTDCIQHPLVLPYLEKLFYFDILPGLTSKGVTKKNAVEVYDDWITRLKHPFFGMDCFFVCQNASTKLSIRVLSTFIANMESTNAVNVSPYMAFAVAAVLRYLTPFSSKFDKTTRGIVFTGKMDSVCRSRDTRTWEYATGMIANLEQGTYEFRDPNENIPVLLHSIISDHVSSECMGSKLTAALSLINGVDLERDAFQVSTFDAPSGI